MSAPSAPFPAQLRLELRRDAYRYWPAVFLAARASESAPVIAVDTEIHLTNLAFALRGLLRVAGVARDVPGVSEAIAEFNRQVPQVIEARDVLEHFDDYRLGEGNLQRAGQCGVFFTVVEMEGAYKTLDIAGRYRIGTSNVTDAAMALGLAVMLAVAPGQPVTVQASSSRRSSH